MKRLIIIIAVIFSATCAYGQSKSEMDALYEEGINLYYEGDIHGAIKKCNKALQIAKRIGHKEAESSLLQTSPKHKI